MDIGLFGKLPSHGDFLRRRVSHAFVDSWDRWLQECLAASRETLGPRWLELYLTSPIWRFAGAAGACGGAPVIGLMVPSVDKVGRYFPFTIVAELPEDPNLLAVTTSSAPVLAEIERLILETLEVERIDFDALDQRLSQLAPTLEASLPPRVSLDADALGVLGDAGPGWHIPMARSNELAAVFEQLCFQRLAAIHDPPVLWYTDGSAAVDPSCLVSKGLPAPAAFAALLDGQWEQRRWRSVRATIDSGDTVEMAIEPAVGLGFRSAAASDVGLVRKNNEDAFLERPEVGLWVVADGLGGHRDGDVASRMLCDAMADLQPMPTLEQTLYAARERIHGVNEHLLRTAPATTVIDRRATTVLLLLARGSSCAVLWAGDSRLYRYRAGTLERMSQDHSAVAEGRAGASAGDSTITRAVGVDATLTLDLVRDRVRPGDRFLLCSDGLTRSVPESDIEQCLQAGTVDDAARGLIRQTLAAGAPDNVTVVVVEAYAPTLAAAAV